MSHIVLLGDSILDNQAYTVGGPPVIKQLNSKLPNGWKTTLLAVDGSMIADVKQQIKKIPSDASHLVLSVGGNNAIMQSGIITETSKQSVGEVFFKVAMIQSQFEQEYLELLNSLLALKLPLAICTIYYPNFADVMYQQLAKMGLVPLNDCILRGAIQLGLPVIDLRFICTTPADYGNEIEPSSIGGAKIADAIVQVVTTHQFKGGQTTIYV
jgi:hypothetical protein